MANLVGLEYLKAQETKRSNLAQEELKRYDVDQRVRTADLDRTSREGIADKDRVSKEDIASKDRASKEGIATADRRSKESIASLDRSSKEDIARLDRASKEDIARLDRASKEGIAEADRTSKETIASKDRMSKELIESNKILENRHSKSDLYPLYATYSLKESFVDQNGINSDNVSPDQKLETIEDAVGLIPGGKLTWTITEAVANDIRSKDLDTQNEIVGRIGSILEPITGIETPHFGVQPPEYMKELLKE